MADPKDKKKTEAEVAAASPEEDHVKYWQGEVDASKKREKAYRKEARELVEIYEAEGGQDIPYNILYSNTETLAPALYNNPPRPDTRPRSKVPNPVADAAAGLVDAYLTNFIDSGDARYPTLDAIAKGAVVQALVPGRAVARFHYKAVVENDAAGQPTSVKDESVFPELVDWDKILFGYAKSWDAVPWVGFIHTFTKEEAKTELGEDAAAKLTYERPKDDDDHSSDSDETAKVSTAIEIWHRASKKIFWIEDGGKLKEFVQPAIADPYGLEGFYPIPEPLQFFQRISCFIPVPLYRLYKQQAGELNRISRRITKLIEAMKLRGFYDSNVEGMEKIFESEENTLIALTSLAALGQGAKAENAIWLVPIEKHIVVLQQLIQQRQVIKQVIFEIMGMADIMRGSSVASETLGAQELKNKWGTLRLKRSQGSVAEFLRGCLRLAAELGLSKLSPETIRQMTGSSLPRQADMDALEQQGQMGQPLPPEAQAQLALPTFEEALALCQSDILRRYAIDIETNSTIDADASEDKQDMTDFLAALGQFLNGLAPMMEKGLLPPETLKGVLLALSRRFRMGRDLDPYFQKLGQGAPQGQEKEKQLQEAQKKLEEGGKQLQAEQQKLKGEADKVAKDKQKLAQDTMAFEMQQAQADIQQQVRALQNQLKDAKAKAGLESTLLQINTAMEKFKAVQAVAAAKEAAEPPEPGEADGE